MELQLTPEAEAKLKAICFSADLRRSDPATAAKAVEAMTRVYIRRGLYEDAVGFFKQLGNEFAGKSAWKRFEPTAVRWKEN